MYLPEGSPEVIGEVPPTGSQEASGKPPFKVSAALTSKVISVLLGIISSQNRASQLAPGTPVSRVREVMVPGEI